MPLYDNIPLRMSVESEGYPGLVDPHELRDVVRLVHITRAILGKFQPKLNSKFFQNTLYLKYIANNLYSSSVKRSNNTEWYLG